MAMEKKTIKSASKWEEASERALIAIWNEKMGELRGCRKNSHILAEMAVQLQEQWFSYTVGEVKTKIHNLTTRYRKEKQMVGTTGGSPSEWDLFQEMQQLLAPFKSYHSEHLLKDSINDINSSISDEISPTTGGVAPPRLSPLEESPLSSSAIISPSPVPSTSSAKSKKKDGF